MTKKIIIVGAGYAGSIIARGLAEDDNEVTIFERRNHIGGNMFDKKDENGILVHQYGPHICYFSNWKTYNYLNRFTDFVPYQHHVLADIDGIEVPLPFNLNSIDKLFPLKKALELKQILISEFGLEKKIPILQLKESKNPKIRKLAEFIYKKVFLNYTTKMWGLKPDELDPQVTGRIPVYISYDDRHFTNEIQVMPKRGYTYIFKKILEHKNIKVVLNTDAIKLIKIIDQKIYYNNKPFNGLLIYTGAIDELMNFKYGKLPYRSLYFEHNTYRVDRLQSAPVLNWPDKRPATRRTENKLLVCQKNIPGVTSTLTEYPGSYDKNDPKWNVPYYPIPSKNSESIYHSYVKDVEKIPNLILIGRLAEYKYYNMEAIILASLDKLSEIKNKL